MTTRPKPAWLHKLCTPGNLEKLTDIKCPACKQWTLRSETNIWETYDPGIITGTDLTTAIILNKQLTRITWNTTLQQPQLHTISGTYGLNPTSQYLALHECWKRPVSLRPFVFPKRGKHGVDGEFRPDRVATDFEVREFERVWALPVCELEKMRSKKS